MGGVGLNVTLDTGGVTYISEHWARADGDIFDLQIIFADWIYNAVETAGTGDKFLSLSIEYPAGVYTQVRFGGLEKASWAAGTNIISDTAKLRIPAGKRFWVRAFIAAQTATVTIGRTLFFASDLRDSYTAGDRTMTNPVAPTVYSTIVAPIAILATVDALNPKAAVMLIDSIGSGSGDSGPADTQGNVGWPAKLLQSASNGVFPYVKLGKPSLSMADMIGSAATLLDSKSVRLRDLLSLLRYSHGLIQSGTNDLTGVTASPQTAVTVTEYFGRLRSLFGGRRTIVATLTPITASTDAWATAGNQAPSASGAQRTLYNGILRAFSYAGMVVIDASDAASSARDSGVWAASSQPLTADGTHPSSTGVARIVSNAAVRAAIVQAV